MHYVFFLSSRRRHTRFDCDWSSDVCSSDLSWHRAPGGTVIEICARGTIELNDGPPTGREIVPPSGPISDPPDSVGSQSHGRSEERRVGKEGRSRWSPDH